MSSPSTVKLEREIYAHHLLHSPHTRERLAEIFSALMLSAGGDTDRLRNYIEIARRGRVDAGIAAGGGAGSKGYPGANDGGTPQGQGVARHASTVPLTSASSTSSSRNCGESSAAFAEGPNAARMPPSGCLGRSSTGFHVGTPTARVLSVRGSRRSRGRVGSSMKPAAPATAASGGGEGAACAMLPVAAASGGGLATPMLTHSAWKPQESEAGAVQLGAAASAPPAEDGTLCRDLVVRGAVTVADRLRAAVGSTCRSREPTWTAAVAAENVRLDGNSIAVAAGNSLVPPVLAWGAFGGHPGPEAAEELGWQRVPAHGFSAGTVMSSPSTVKLEREIYAHHLLHSPHTRERLAEIFSALMLSAGGDTDRLRNYIEIARRGRVDAVIAAGGGAGSKGYPGGPEDKEERRPWKVKLRRAPELATTGGSGRVHQAAPVAGPVARGHHEGANDGGSPQGQGVARHASTVPLTLASSTSSSRNCGESSAAFAEGPNAARMPPSGCLGRSSTGFHVGTPTARVLSVRGSRRSRGRVGSSMKPAAPATAASGGGEGAACAMLPVAAASGGGLATPMLTHSAWKQQSSSSPALPKWSQAAMSPVGQGAPSLLTTKPAPASPDGARAACAASPSGSSVATVSASSPFKLQALGMASVLDKSGGRGDAGASSSQGGGVELGQSPVAPGGASRFGGGGASELSPQRIPAGSPGEAAPATAAAGGRGGAERESGGGARKELGWQRVPAHGFSAGTVMSSPSTVKLEREIYAHYLRLFPDRREPLAKIISALMLSAGGDTDRLRNYIEIARRGRVDAGVAAGGGGGSKGYPGGPEDKEERRPWKVKLRRAPGLATTGGFGRVHQAAPVAGPVARGHHEGANDGGTPQGQGVARHASTVPLTSASSTSSSRNCGESSAAFAEGPNAARMPPSGCLGRSSTGFHVGTPTARVLSVRGSRRSRGRVGSSMKPAAPATAASGGGEGAACAMLPVAAASGGGLATPMLTHSAWKPQESEAGAVQLGAAASAPPAEDGTLCRDLVVRGAVTVADRLRAASPVAPGGASRLGGGGASELSPQRIPAGSPGEAAPATAAAGGRGGAERERGGGARKLKDEDVQLLLDSCPFLSVLSVADCTTLGSLILRSRQLKSLDVSRCIHISEMSLDMPALTRLDANWCTKLPDLAVESVVGSCLALEHLGLKGCSALVSPSIQSAKLKSLDLSLCGKLTTCSISGPSLTELKVAMCMGLNSLTLDLPVMTSLDLSMLDIKNLTLNCNKLVYANLRGSYKLESSVGSRKMQLFTLEETGILLFLLRVLVGGLMCSAYFVVGVALVVKEEEPSIPDIARLLARKVAALARRLRVASRVKKLVLFFLKMISLIFIRLIPFLKVVGLTMLVIIYMVKRLVDAFMTTFVSAWRWCARRSTVVDEDTVDGAFAQERTSTADMTEPENALQIETANDPVAKPELANEPSAADDVSGRGGGGNCKGKGWASPPKSSLAAGSRGTGVVNGGRRGGGGGGGGGRASPPRPSPAAGSIGTGVVKGGGRGGGGGVRPRSPRSSTAGVFAVGLTGATRGDGGRGGKRKSKTGVTSGRRGGRLLPRPSLNRVQWADHSLNANGKRKAGHYEYVDKKSRSTGDMMEDRLQRRIKESRKQRTRGPIDEGVAAVPWFAANFLITKDKFAVQPFVWQLQQPDKGGEAKPSSPEDAVAPTTSSTSPTPLSRFNKKGEDLLAPVVQGETAHCCTVDHAQEKDGWLPARYRELDDNREVPGVQVYIPVTIVRGSGRQVSSAAEETVYVRPGGGKPTRDWAENGSLIWEVPRSAVLNKAPAEAGSKCDACRDDKWGCSWTPDRLELLCNACADAPRRLALEFFELNGYGQFKWAHSCDCNGGFQLA
eukprot:g15670.t1